jgi:hypothetical protein
MSYIATVTTETRHALFYFFALDMSPKKAETILSILNLTDHRHYACVRTRKDDPETYKQAFRHLGEIIHLDSAL